jgi:hypothetical protein
MNKIIFSARVKQCKTAIDQLNWGLGVWILGKSILRGLGEH